MSVTIQPTERLFVALSPPDPVRHALGTLAETLPGVAWTSSDQMHLTLRFLGEVTPALQEAVIDRLRTVRVASFILPVEGMGTFPPKSPPRVVWVGVGHGHPRLFQLRQRLDDALLAAGVPLDVRTFQPHATIARCSERAAAAVERWARKHHDFIAPPFRVEAFDLYASERRAAGTVYILKHRFALAEE